MLSGPIGSVMPKDPKSFGPFREDLERNGYLVGLTAHALPYDSRKSIQHY